MTEAEEKIILLLGQILERLSSPAKPHREVDNTDPSEAKAWARGKLIELKNKRENRKKRGDGSAQAGN